MSQRREEAKKEDLPARGVALPASMHSHQDEEREVPNEGEEDEDTGGGLGEDEEENEGPQVGDDTTEPNQGAVDAAIQRANEESQVIDGRPVGGKAKSGEGRAQPALASMKSPIVKDVDEMDEEQLRAEIRRLIAQQQQRAPGVPLQKAIRWNNGSEPNVQGGELVSARDTGSISVYGFGRRPVTLYAGQWVSLAHYMPDILHFIEQRLGPINSYVEKRLGNKSKSLSRQELEDALSLFMIEHSHKEEEEGSSGDVKDASAGA